MLQATFSQQDTIGKQTPLWIVCFAALILVQIPNATLEVKKFLLDTDPNNLTAIDYLAAISAYTTGPIAVLFMIMQQRRMAIKALLDDLGLTNASRKPIYLGLLLGIFAMASTVIIGTLFDMASNTSNQSLIDYHKGVLGVISLLYITTLSGPFLEEVLFRGWLFKRAMNTWLGSYGAALLSSFLFMMMHVGPGYQPVGLFVLFCTALICAWLRFRFVSLWPAIAMHASYNACLVTFILLQQ